MFMWQSVDMWHVMACPTLYKTKEMELDMQHDPGVGVTFDLSQLCIETSFLELSLL